MTDSGYNDTSVLPFDLSVEARKDFIYKIHPREPSHVMGAARSDPGGGEIPMKATKPFVVCPESVAGFPVRDVVDKYDCELIVRKQND